MQIQNHLEPLVIETEPWKIYDKLVEEGLKWYDEVNEIMIELGTNVFPSCKQFSQCKREGLYNRINNYMGKDLFCDTYGILIN